MKPFPWPAILILAAVACNGEDPMAVTEIPTGTPCDETIAADVDRFGEPDLVLFDEPGIRVTGLPGEHFLELRFPPATSAVYAWGGAIGDGCGRSVTFGGASTEADISQARIQGARARMSLINVPSTSASSSTVVAFAS